MGAHAVDVSAQFARAWAVAEQAPPPSRLRRLQDMPWEAFKAEIRKPWFADELVSSLYRGDAWVLRGAFPRAFMGAVKLRTAAWTRGREPSFHKMLEGSPDFHRVIDLEAGKQYSFECCKHAAYFYRWNDDPLRVWPTVTERWRVIKQVMGLAADAYEKNTPKDGVVDRVQVVRYPPAIGYLEPHQDPHRHQRVFLSAYMSKRGVDFKGGGFYFVAAGDRVVDVEDQLEVGDICIGYATVMHGVAPCDRDKQADWNATDGRWFLSLYSNESDEARADGTERHTGRPAKLEVAGVRP